MWNIPQWGVLWEVSSTHQRACGRHFGAGTFPDTPSDAPTRKSLGSSQIKSQVAISPGPESQQEWADPAISPLQAFPGFMVLNCPHPNLLPLSASQREKWEESSPSGALAPSDPGSNWTQSSSTTAGGKEPIHQTGLSPWEFSTQADSAAVGRVPKTSLQDSIP